MDTSKVEKGSSADELSKTVVEPLESFTSNSGLNVRILSGKRSPEHNKSVGGADNSPHLTGDAADIEVALGDKSAEQVKQELFDAGFTTVGLITEKDGKAYYHVDARNLPEGNKRMELIYENGKYKSARYL